PFSPDLQHTNSLSRRDPVSQIMMFQVDKPLNRAIPDAYQFSKTQTMNTTIVPFGQVDNIRELALYGLKKDGFGRTILQIGTPDGGPTPFEGDGSMPEEIKLGATERWVVYNNTDHTHPMHLHQVAFQVISRQRFTADIDPKTGIMTNIKLLGQPKG